VTRDSEREPIAEPSLHVVTQIGRPSLAGVVRLVAILSGCAVALYLLYLTRGVIKLFVIAVFTAIALAPVVDAVQRTGLRRAWAIAVVYATCILAVVGVSAVVVPSVASQLGELSRSAERTLADVRGNATVRRYDDRYHITDKLQAQLQHLPERAGDAAGPLRDVTVGAIGFASDLLAVLSIAFLLILHGDRYTTAALGALSPGRAARLRRVGPRIHSAVSGYVLGNLAISLLAGTGAWIVMTLLGVPFALPLAIAMAFFDLIPMVGAALGAVLVALAALVVAPLTAVLWLVYCVLYQQVENYLIAPVVYRRTVQVSPLVTILAVLVGAALLGLLGALLAIPAAAATQLVVEDLRAERRLESRRPRHVRVVAAR
jgi:predicted PurR-regulated permease PerM